MGIGRLYSDCRFLLCILFIQKALRAKKRQTKYFLPPNALQRGAICYYAPRFR
ncbi:hypothetical protein HMPREF0454_02672 [Hafnia alvei ATCC 51873]|uniref:Uncharacterized protein n=1 Tax=Hafnia alvei ATCC 51873 TaxID=1002364 RepID=G9Y7Q4_HAFAL|nr:hypothetical protein HMPREF0454_02672 [Hafnia alvei ATCC 51873]